MRRAACGISFLCLTSACFDPDDGAPADTDATDGSTSTSTATTEPSGPGTNTDTTTGPTTSPTTEHSTTADPSSTSTTDDTTSTTEPGSTGGSSTGGIEILECVDALLDPAQGDAVATVDTNTTGSDFMGSCGGLNTNDAAYQWIVPFSDFFVIDTEGSDFDTVLYLLDDTCDGTELACNDNVDGSAHSEIVASFEEGQQVVVVVDGAAGESGNAVLNINPVECPSADLNGQALPATFSNVAGTNEFTSQCGGQGNPERTFRFTAEDPGLYSFRAVSSDFSPIMIVEEGPVCGGDRWQCNRGSAAGVPGEVIRNLEAGQSVTLIVDSNGGTGDFEIDVTNVGQTCPEVELEGGFGVTEHDGNIADFDHRMTTSCAPTGYVFNMDLDLFEAATFSWTSPGQVGTSSGCNIEYTGGFPAALSLQTGSCNGPEVQCEQAVVNATEDGYQSSVSVGHIPPTEFTITLVRAAEIPVPVFSEDFTITIGCYAVG